ncbi:hypothetical protein CAOG_04994 [Capsaspora owczarzaki ATCC 30864]|uniref:Endonuclease/exonuclease/phosphatase domain-containing protein n=1 Tax=Capsaspora owczarzaki (strain ATCC 30864) TaxID=595528 RepID=A0A0D2WR52_CAPO3|nr:hypothetical protein CAOG_04994 [Capsaspora owczarzaki ATCC 30864]KJE94335.1 hypothetical protein CAOG_004994 [Capsaspora owczarzaki ATCC 30864]|eukprot:XP_004346679.1 hypothetical protein CAOG_04994 [Capsaspora owczarzaki ATCC 30864]
MRLLHLPRCFVSVSTTTTATLSTSSTSTATVTPGVVVARAATRVGGHHSQRLMQQQQQHYRRQPSHPNYEQRLHTASYGGAARVVVDTAGMQWLVTETAAFPPGLPPSLLPGFLPPTSLPVPASIASPYMNHPLSDGPVRPALGFLPGLPQGSLGSGSVMMQTSTRSSARGFHMAAEACSSSVVMDATLASASAAAAFSDDHFTPASAVEDDSSTNVRSPRQQARPPLPPPMYKQLRNWRTFHQDPSDASSHAHNKFKVMSYNILANQHFRNNSYLYRWTPSAARAWSYRRANLVAEITALQPDILCLQELDSYHDLPETLRHLGYSGRYFKKTGGEATDACAIFVKSDRFAINRVHNVQNFIEGSRVLTSHNIGMLAVVTMQLPTAPWIRKMIVATTHLHFNPKRGEIKLLQLMKLFAEIRRVRAELTAQLQASYQSRRIHHPVSPIPVVLAGDFNLTPDSDLYRFIETGEISYSGLDRTAISGQLRAESRHTQAVCDATREHHHLLGEHPVPLAAKAPSHFISRSSSPESLSRRPRPLPGSDVDDLFLCHPLVPPELPIDLNCSWLQDDAASTLSPPAPEATIRHHFNFASAYAETDRHPDQQHFATSINERSMSTVDYIFFEQSALSLTGLLDLQPVSEIRAIASRDSAAMLSPGMLRQYGLPCMTYSSDHVNLMCEFALR